MSRAAKGAIAAVAIAALVAGPLVALNAVRGDDVSNARPAEGAQDRELVVTYLTADGTVDRVSFVDSLTVFGDGPVTLTDVGEAKGFRNLSGFEQPSFDGTEATWTIEVAGQKELLTASDAGDRTLPVEVTPRYFLDGDEVSPEALGGATGHVRVEFALRNATERTDPLTVYVDGEATTKETTTFLPLLAQVSIDLPSSMWKNLSVPGGRVITDDNGIHHVSFNPILAPLLGNPSQSVAIEGDVTDLEFPDSRIVVLPLVPPGSSVDTARATTDGALTLYDGVGQIDAGLGDLHAGAQRLLAGLQELNAGIVAMEQGVGTVGNDATIVGGLALVLDGLEQMGDSESGLPYMKAGVQDMIAGLRTAIAGIGTLGADGTILGGLNDVEGGLGALDAGLGTTATDDTILGGLSDVGDGIDGVNAGVGSIGTLIGGAPNDAASTPGVATTVRNDNEFMKDTALQAVAACDAYATLLGQMTCTQMGLSAAAFGGIAGSVEAKLAGARTAITGQLQPGLTQLAAGVDELIVGGEEMKAGVALLSGGVALLIDGVQELKAGLRSGDINDPGLLEGLQLVRDGLTTAIAGLGTVGTPETLIDGTSQLLSGAQDLGDGLGQARAGVGAIGAPNTLTDGTSQVVGGSAQLADGTSQVLTGVAGSAAKGSEALAVLEAMSARATEEAFLYGPPSGSTGSAAYVFELNGINARNVQSAAKAGIAVALVIALAIAGRSWMRRTAMGTPAI